MITPSFGLTATERVLPKLALDFTTASLDSRVTFTRTTSASNPATYVDSSGYITAASNNQPRFDYNPVTLVCKGLLIEESRSNLLNGSEDFSSTYYTATGASVVTDNAVSPSNTLTADFLKEDSANSTHFLTKTPTLSVTSGTTYTFSIFGKYNGRSWVRLNIQSGSNFRAYFNVATGVIGTLDAGVTASIATYKNGFYRCTLTATAGANTAIAQIHLASADGVVTYQGDGTSGIYLWGAQLEAGAFATSYIPTTTTALTRNADVATMTGTNFSSWFNASEGTFSCAFDLVGAGAFQEFVSANTDGNNFISINASNTNVLRQTVLNGGAAQVSSLTSGTMSVGGVYSTSAAYKLDSFAVARDGGTVVSDAGGTLPTCSNLSLGARTGTTNVMSGHLKKVNFWPMRLSNAEVQAFSKG